MVPHLMLTGFSHPLSVERDWSMGDAERVEFWRSGIGVEGARGVPAPRAEG